MSQAERPSLRAARSILSSPVSASLVRCPTSVMLITWVTRKPSRRSGFFSTSGNT